MTWPLDSLLRSLTAAGRDQAKRSNHLEIWKLYQSASKAHAKVLQNLTEQAKKALFVMAGGSVSGMTRDTAQKAASYWGLLPCWRVAVLCMSM